VELLYAILASHKNTFLLLFGANTGQGKDTGDQNQN
jgi:hypothetical protein